MDRSVFAPFHTGLPFGTFDFEALKTADFPAAFAEARLQHRGEIESLVSNPAEADFANTVVALERSGRQLARVSGAFAVYRDAHADDTVRAIEQEQAPLSAAHRDAVSLDPRLWLRIQAVQENQRGVVTSEDRRLLELTYKGFVRAGARLSEADKETIKALNQEEATLVAQMQERTQKGVEAAAPFGASAGDLAGLNAADTAVALEGAADRPGSAWVLPLVNCSVQPALSEVESPAVRARILTASLERNAQEGPFDTRPFCSRLSAIRAEQARLLGFAHYADFVMEPQMTKTADRMRSLLSGLAAPATARAAQEAQHMERVLGRTVPLADRFWAEAEVRRREHGIDDAEVAPYFELERVIEDGLFHTARELYGLGFHRRHDLPVYQPDVRVYEVHQESGEPIALFYFDLFARASKQGGAWMTTFVDQNRLCGEKPVVANVLNITPAPEGQPVFLSLDEVNTLFHEFGHGLHGLLSDVVYLSMGGANVATDFVELPSQIHEHWMFHPDVMSRYARHHETGEPIPAELVARLRAANRFGQGYKMAELAQAALLDLAWHTRTASDAPVPPEGVADFERTEAAGAGFDPDAVPPRYRSPYFAHIWTGGYAANYGAYIASAVLECDGFAWFEENGGLTRANGEHFRRTVLSRGNTQPADELYRAFRGRDAVIEPLLLDRGLASEPVVAKRPRP